MHENGPRDRKYRFGDFLLVSDGPMLLRDGVRVAVTPRVLNVLLVLVDNAGRVVTKETLMNKVWADSFVEEGNLNRTISRLRQSLGEAASENRFIETIPRVGYRFIADVEDVTTVSPSVGPTAKAGEASVPTVRTFPAIPLLVGIGVVALTAVIALSIWFVKTRSSPHVVNQPGNKQEPIRLTDNPSREDHPAFTKDGKIRFSRWQGSQPRSFVMEADGSDQHRDASIPGMKTGLWSPNGKKVLFYKESDDDGALYLADSNGSNESRLPFLAGNMDWSPDSTRIIYQYGLENSDIFLYDIGSGHTVKTVENPAFDGDPTFSPDGQSIAFVSDRDGNPEIYLQNLDGTDLRRVTNHPAQDAFPTFSPDGTQLAFNSDREDENREVYLMNIDGSGIQRLTNSRSDDETYPGCWSPDGTQLLFTSDRSGKDNIYAMNVEPITPVPVIIDVENDLRFPSYSPDGKLVLFQSGGGNSPAELRFFEPETKQTRTLVKLEEADSNARISPDGRWIVFQNRVDGNAEIFRIPSSGGEPQRLTIDPGRDTTPAWSPDGNRIVFSSNRGESYSIFQLYVMNADGSDQHRIYYSKAISQGPSWSPDGKQIIFANDKEDNRSGNFEIFSIEPETVNPERRLTFHRRYDVTPTFSPDGTRIAFSSNADGNSEIYIMRSDGSGLLRLTRDRAEDLNPSWAADGSKMIFSSNRTGKFAIYELTPE